MSALTHSCASCGRPLSPGASCSACAATDESTGLHAGGYFLVAIVVVGCLLIGLKLFGFLP